MAQFVTLILQLWYLTVNNTRMILIVVNIICDECEDISFESKLSLIQQYHISWLSIFQSLEFIIWKSRAFYTDLILPIAFMLSENLQAGCTNLLTCILYNLAYSAVLVGTFNLYPIVKFEIHYAANPNWINLKCMNAWTWLKENVKHLCKNSIVIYNFNNYKTSTYLPL